jgi:hypothetical protein
LITIGLSPELHRITAIYSKADQPNTSGTCTPGTPTPPRRDPAMNPDTIPLHLSQLPRRVELELKAGALEQLQALSQRSGRCIDELALELIDRALQRENRPDGLNFS